MNSQTGFIFKTLEFQGEKFPYAAYVPAEYTPQSAWPAILFLHGAGERGNDGRKQTTVGLPRIVREQPEQFPCLVVMPQCRPEQKWDPFMQDVAIACLDTVQRDYRIDANRIVLTGLSLGGFGTWAIGARFPERFCALVPVCGGGDPTTASQLAKIPIWCFHGDADPVVPVQRSREMVHAVQNAGGQVRYTELAGVAHNSWDPAYENPELIQWMLSQRRG